MKNFDLQIAALTEGISVPSSRYRVEQFICPLREHNIDLKNYPSFFGKYPPASKILRPFWFAGELLSRSITIQKVNFSCDKILLQRELISSFSYLEHFLKKPIIFDFDDAIFLGKNQRNIIKILKMSNQVICGNKFLADWASQYSNYINIIPTGLDTSFKYNPEIYKKNLFNESNIYIGWIGTSSNLKFLYEIEEQLARIIKENANTFIAVMSDKKPKFNLIPAEKVIFTKWSDEVEPIFLNSIDIGIMPLSDSQWAQGKCSFKAIQYMSMKKIVILSNIGMNSSLVKDHEDGFLVNHISKWCETINMVLSERNSWEDIGAKAREKIIESYSLETLTPMLAKVLNYN